ncbi:Hsp20/alpha crystallin family protein [Peribacillus glennii]|uniref:Hsp20/alpha crystallin family protein n=1 Tax=Peribacillus glennii TaxID=2303991 RepID=A0A372LGI8_9BACI|nr:Hsp20/alpha crystallin family protein [Peribacillus glennii]RFU65415.1 Hsp20/alpha crystallin family protein [Peribacillus glennii]
MFPWNFLFPFLKNNRDNLPKSFPFDVQSLINQVVSQVIPDNLQQMMDQNTNQGVQNSKQNVKNSKRSNHPLNADVFETHSEVYVRVPIKDPEWVKQVKIFHTTNQSIIEGIPDQEDKHVITLPAIVKKKGSSAKYKDDTLEIRLVKNTDFQYSQIDVTEI